MFANFGPEDWILFFGMIGGGGDRGGEGGGGRGQGSRAPSAIENFFFDKTDLMVVSLRDKQKKKPRP